MAGLRDTPLERIYAYVPNHGRFILHWPLNQDFSWDRALDWISIE